uniref:SAM domain-containing protein n=1 Tax=Laticauda laticaudata TaxID=8630 RepID=A0A8C5SKI3_LATLA
QKRLKKYLTLKPQITPRVLCHSCMDPHATQQARSSHSSRKPEEWGQEDSSRGSDNSSYDETLSPTSPGPLSVRSSHGERELVNSNMTQPISDLHGINPVFLSSNPSHWSVEEVYEFIASLQGCQEIAEEFRSQEIDGQALLLLKEEHLMSAMNIKLGPALKICAKINILKET